MKIDWKLIWLPFDKWIEANKNMGCTQPSMNRIQSVLESAINQQLIDEPVVPNVKLIFRRLYSWMQGGLVYSPELERIKKKFQSLTDEVVKQINKKEKARKG